MTTRQLHRKDSGFRNGSVMVLSFSHFIHDIYLSFLAPLLPRLIDKFGLSMTQAGFLSTMLQIPALINPYLGTVADRMNGRYFIILAPSLTAVAMSALGAAPNYYFLLLLLFVAGVSTSLFHVPAPVLIHHLSGEKSGRGMSFYMTGGELARAAGPVFIIAIVSVSGLEGYYPVLVIGVATSFFLHLKFRDIPVPIKAKDKVPLMDTIRETKQVFIPISGILIARGFMHATMTSFLPVYIELETGNLWLAGISLALVEAAGVLGILTLGPLSDRLGRKNTILLCLVTAPVSMMAFLGTAGWLRYLFLILTGFTLLSATPVMLALVQEHARKGPAAANGLFIMLSFLSRSSIVVLVGFAADRFGLGPTYLASALFGLVGIPFILLLPGRSGVRFWA